MNNEIIKVEEGQLIIAKNIIDKIKELEAKKKHIDKIEKEFKDKLKEIMEQNQITKYTSNDETLKISYTPATKPLVFDTERFIKEHHELYVEYQKESYRSGNLRITIKEKVDE